MPIFLAILLNELAFKRYKKVTQTIVYLPHFLSWIIISGIAKQLLAPRSGIMNVLLNSVGVQSIDFLTHPTLYIGTYIAFGLWKEMGWNTIIYLAAITGINPELYEAAEVDGASRWKKIWHITLPGIRSTIVVLLIMNLGRILGSEFDRPYSFSNSLVMSVADVLSTYVYRVGIRGFQFSLTAAVGLFQSVICVILMKRKWLSLILASIMIVSVLGGCKAKSEEVTPTEQDTTVSEPTKAPEEEATAAPVEAAKPEYSEITVEVFDRGTDGGKTDPTNNFYTDWIKAKVLEDENIGVTFVAVSRWEETDQLNNLMAAGTAPDVCLTYSGDLIANYRDLGGLADLAPYVDTLLPDLKAFLGPDLALEGRDMIMRNVNTETGQLFSIPARRMNTAGASTFIRKDWLDKLGLPLPKTTQEFYDALTAFKTQDPGGVGKDKVVPFTMTSDVRWRASNLLESFIDPNISRKDRWVNTVIEHRLYHDD